MRIRTVKPDFWQSETLATVSREARLLAVSLLNWADDEGYFKSHPALIAGALFPFEPDGREFVDSGMRELIKIGYIKPFAGGISQITNFKQHQVINKPVTSKLAHLATEEITQTPITTAKHPKHPPPLPESYRSPTGVGMEDEGQEVEREMEKEVERKDMSTSDKPKIDISAVFEHWAQTFRKSKRTVFDEKRKSLVKARLRDGFSIEDLKRAIDGCAQTPFNTGQNDRGERYDDLTLICRDAAHVERFIRNAENPPVSQHISRSGAIAPARAENSNWDHLGPEGFSDAAPF